MFYDTECYVVDADKTKTYKMNVDIQPYEKTIQYEDDIEIDITHRVFCDKIPQLPSSHYFLIGNTIYKVIKIKEWSNYLECWLYQCEVD